MAKNVWYLLGGLGWLANGCAGKASNDGAGAAGRESQGSPTTSGNAGVPSTGPVPDGTSACMGTLSEASDGLGFSCPAEYCVGKAASSFCDALPSGVIKTSTQELVLSFEFSPTRRKVCYYRGSSLATPGGGKLWGAAAWDDQASFCGGTARHIVGGGAPAAWDSQHETTLCDLADPTQNQANEATPPRACFNDYSNSCEVCCPEPQPDCAGKPTGYPGYSCTPSSPGNSFCSCACSAGSWSCGC